MKALSQTMNVNFYRMCAMGAVALLGFNGADAAPTHLVEEAPVSITHLRPGVVLADFGRVAFGNLKLTPPAGATNEIQIHFGEAVTDGRINRKPPGSVRYAVTNAMLMGRPMVVAPAPDARNTAVISDKQPPAILTPADWGVVLPFRWVEIEGWPGELTAQHLTRRAAFASTWDDEAAAFHCSDDMLNRIWELCHYSIKATTFAGVYVDGDRERIPYEADAYLNQLSHYYTDRDTQMARDTFDHLMKYPTWPTEWASHMIFMAHADWMHTGDKSWLAPRYPALKAKLLLDRAGPDGLLLSTTNQIKKGDLVDWPVKERDGFVFTPVNTVVNAFHLRSLAMMAELARAVGRDAEAQELQLHEQRVRAVFNEKLLQTGAGLYRDGVGTEHTSLHANLFPLAFGLVPEANRTKVAEWLVGRGMRCSVYAAQYLLEGLFEHGQVGAAIDLMLAPGDRSWRHMLFTNLAPMTIRSGPALFAAALACGVVLSISSAQAADPIEPNRELNTPRVLTQTERTATLFTQTDSDPSFEEVLKGGDLPRGQNSRKGVTGSRIQVNRKLVEQTSEARQPLPKAIKLHTLGNSAISRTDFPKWSRWYQEEGSTQVFRLFKGEENVRNARENAARVEAFSEVNWERGDWHEWSGTYTIIKPHGAAIFQVKNNVNDWAVQINMSSKGDVILNHRRGEDKVIARDMVAKPFRIRVRDNGHDYEVFLENQKVGAEFYARPEGRTAFRWGIYVGKNEVAHDAMIFVSGATVDAGGDKR